MKPKKDVTERTLPGAGFNARVMETIVFCPENVVVILFAKAVMGF